MEQLTVTFELHFYTGNGYEHVAESALGDDLDRYRELLAAGEGLEGAIVIKVPGRPPVAVEDELFAVAQNLCFSLVARAIEETAECLLYRRTSAEGYVVMLPSETVIRLIGDDIPRVTADRSELLPALHACGVRVIDLLERIGGADDPTAEHLRTYEARARAALSAAR